ncbi:MAG TPA: hypothetical protein DET40_20680 [Lentisphaeria bacterium]|nr:MAG: hypothetical protein A2X45_16085 [Lentisphaerae bacterium GWF2_50_93]HCE45969.1 hypothetical protein [Lentisphaeria bacterium]
MEKFKKNFAIFAVGMFAIASQAIIFREFLGSFESNDIAVGVFFATWFFWIALGASIVFSFGNLSEKMSAKTHFVILLYVPAFLSQSLLIMNIRSLAGVEAYEVFPIWKLISWSLLANGPVSFLTGAIFPLACRWTAGNSKFPVAGTFIYESLGSCIGGAGTTLLLYAGVPVEYLAMPLCLTVVAACAIFLRKERAVMLLSCAVMLTAAGIFFKVGDGLRIQKWKKLLPAESYRGWFATPQAEYLYGVYNGQWSIVREGGAGESVPDSESALKIISVHLCQKPDAKKILVIGSGLNLCREFLKFPQIEEISWIHYDGEYIRRVNACLPPELRISDVRFHTVPGSDAREFLKRRDKAYDIVIVNMPDATSSVVNRYFTIEFYEAVSKALTRNGILGTRVSAGENVIGPELAFAGASVKNSLAYVFKKSVVVTGDSSWFIASDSSWLTGDPGILEKRLGLVKGIGKILPVESLRSLYLPDREKLAEESYAAAFGAAPMINSDSMPLGFLYALLLSSRQSGMDITGLSVKIIQKGMLVLLVPLLVFLIMALVSAVSECSSGTGEPGAGRIIFCIGYVSMGTVIVLMYMFQTLLGSLYVNAGLVSALFMLGLAAGGMLVLHPVLQKRVSSGASLVIALTAHVLLLFAISYQTPDFWNFGWFVLAFSSSGICCGLYFPIAARMLKESGKGEIESGGGIETADHVGACAGAATCGILIVPFFGTGGALIFFMMFLALNLPISSTRMLLGSTGHENSTPALILRLGAYILFGAGASLAIWGLLIFNMNISFYIMVPAFLLFIVLSFMKGRSWRMLLFAVALVLAVSSAVELWSALGKKDDRSFLKPTSILEQPAKSMAEKNAGTVADRKTEDAPPGTSRDVDMQKLNGRIKAGRLSGKEAEFYEKMDGK